MCNATCIIFGATNLTKEEIRGKSIIEVGALDVNGSMRPIVESWGPSEYIGVDIEDGRGVDFVCRAEDIVKKFGNDKFDIVITTEMLEHVRDWRTVISNLKKILKPGGILLITTRSQGFDYHGYPSDFWRYELEDMKQIFSDFKILNLESDRRSPGVFLKAIKPSNWREVKLDDIELYSIITDKKQKDIDDLTLNKFHKEFKKRQSLKKTAAAVINPLKKLAKAVVSKF